MFETTGTVIDRQTDSRTSVHGSVSGGHGRISSSTTEYLTLFLREQNGAESSVLLQDFSIPVRVGNRVTIIFAGMKTARSGRPAAIYNHDTSGENIRAETIEQLASVSKAGCALLIIVPIVAFLALGTAARVAFAALGEESALSLLLAAAWLISPIAAFVIMLRHGRRQTREAKQLQSEIRAAVQRRLDAAKSAAPGSLPS